LSIVQHIASLHQANISLQNNDDGPGLTASVFFPADLHVVLGLEGRRQ